MTITLTFWEHKDTKAQRNFNVNDNENDNVNPNVNPNVN